MIDEAKVLEVVKSVTNTDAYFFNGTLFLNTGDSKTAVEVFSAIYNGVTPAITFCKSGNETVYDFI
jgi:hypothetical protein